REIIDIVDPDYYASGVTLLTIKANHVTKWEDLKGKWVCTLEGARFNKEFADKYRFDAQTYVGTAGATDAALANRCVGFLDDDAHAIGVLQDPKMRKVLEMPVETQSYVPWGMAVRLGNPLFHAFVADTIADWHRTGLIIELEKKYGIPPAVGRNRCTTSTLLRRSKAQSPQLLHQTFSAPPGSWSRERPESA